MDKILNSIILFSILYTPINKFELNSNKIHNIISKKQSKETRQINSEDINLIMSEIDTNFNLISKLFKEKKNLSNSLNEKFNSKIKNKENLTEQQMESFKSCNHLLREEEQNISIHTANIRDKKEMILLKNELISSSDNFSIIYTKLCNILNNQMKLIASLYKALFHLRISLEIL